MDGLETAPAAHYILTGSDVHADQLAAAVFLCELEVGRVGSRIVVFAEGGESCQFEFWGGAEQGELGVAHAWFDCYRLCDRLLDDAMV
jgi:hypothetical protein